MNDASSLPVVIVGGGFSGAMLAARLAERGQASVLIERGEAFGPGVAYSTTLPEHRLNVRSERMSAVVDRPRDFVDWLEECASSCADPEGFAPRLFYGQYIRDRLTTLAALRPDLIQQVKGEAVAIDGQTVALSDGRRIEGRAVVLATGNPAPRNTPTGQSPRVLSDPWAPGVLERIQPDDAVLILGSGLTMVDVVLALQAQGWRGRATAVSRRGLLPRAHGAHHDAPVALPPEALTGALSQRLASARRLTREHGWRRVMEGYRPITADLWRAATTAERARFLRHLRPWWDVHRHRIAPEIAAALEALIAEGRLSVRAGRVRATEVSGDAATLTVNAPGGAVQTLTAQWLIDCTGPGHSAATTPLTAALIAEGRARLDPLKLGLDLDETGRILHADGTVDPDLYVLGPPARAALWETIAVPDLRQRIEQLSQALTT
ncbi:MULTISPECIES: FAD/NAD(P)-binding protein [unclassified Brevundimonas]|uniref:FAD/NAD(P)-binding protein n=1 Tax=unclassified Brevundimonas TaxID=2622653 RepID=UPI0025B7CB62|nr:MULTISPECIES: FAD/NAD(P)-binding protein [unclassified Brevundimonas]